MQDKIKELLKLEEEVVKDLQVLAKYVKIADKLKLDEKTTVSLDEMNKAIDAYDKGAMKLAEKSDSTIASLFKTISDIKAKGPRSYFSSL